jgi:hypothetical protein
MLKITRAGNGEMVFKVSGQLNVENLAELEKLIKAERKGGRIVLDLTDLISVDGDAVEFVAKCETDGSPDRGGGESGDGDRGFAVPGLLAYIVTSKFAGSCRR